jgi:hypothetical protein
MAEKQTLFEINIDIDAAIKDSQRLAEEIEILKDQTKRAKEEQGELSEEYLQYNATLKATQKELRQNNKLTEDAIAADQAKEGSIEQLRRQLSVVTKQWKDLSQEERTNSEEGKKLTNQKTLLTAKLKEEERATGDARRNVGNYSEGIEGATKSSGLFGKATGALGGQFQALGGVIKGALGPIALIFGLFKTLQAAIQRNKKATEALNQVFAVFRGVVDGVLNALGPVVEFLTDKLQAAFDNPRQAITDLGNAIKENLINRFKAFGVFGKSIAALFRGEFKEAAKLAGDAVIQLGTGVEDGTEKIKGAIEKTKEFVKTAADETKKAIDINKRLANSERELLEISKQFELQQLRFQDQAEKQRQIRDDESASIEDRIQANERLGEILDEQLQKELALAQKQLEFAELRKQVDGDTIETQEAILDGQIKIAEINERISGQRSEQLTNENALLKEQKELEEEKYLSQAEAANAAFEAELQRYDDLLNAELEYLENQKAIQEDNIFAVLDIEKQKLELKKEQELAFTEATGAQKAAIEKKYAKAEEEIEKAKTSAKLALAGGLAANIATIVGEQTALGKAAAIAETTISTYQSAQASYQSLAGIPVVGPALGFVAAAAAVATGVANVKKILAVKTPGKGGGGGSSISAGGSAPRTTTVNPAIGQGIVSRQDVTNRSLQESIEGVEMQPVLVEDEVTNKQKVSEQNQNIGVI